MQHSVVVEMQAFSLGGKEVHGRLGDGIGELGGFGSFM